jgi:hypothetical protein
LIVAIKARMARVNAFLHYDLSELKTSVVLLSQSSLTFKDVITVHRQRIRDSQREFHHAREYGGSARDHEAFIIPIVATAQKWPGISRGIADEQKTPPDR